MLASSFSSVLLPEPLRPTMPKNSPWPDLEGDAAQRPQVAVVAAGEGVDDPLFERVDPVGRDAERLVQAFDLDRGGGGEGIGRQNVGTLPLGRG